MCSTGWFVHRDCVNSFNGFDLVRCRWIQTEAIRFVFCEFLYICNSRTNILTQRKLLQKKDSKSSQFILLIDIETHCVWLLPKGQFWPSCIVVACVCLDVSIRARQSRTCPCDNLSLVQPGITKFGPEVQHNLFKIPIIFRVDCACQNDRRICDYLTFAWRHRSNVVTLQC